MDKKLTNLKAHCEHYIEVSQKAEKDFIQNVKESPLFAFEWQDGVIEAISYGKMCERILKAIENGRTFKQLVEDIAESCLKNSQWRNKSTSAMSNLVKDIEQQTRGKFLEYIKYM